MSNVVRLAVALLSLIVMSSFFVLLIEVHRLVSNPVWRGTELMPLMEVVNTYLPFILFFSGIPMAMLMVININRMVMGLMGVFPDEAKKSYEDEMSHYDEMPQQLEQPRSGISLDDLVALRESDGELPESAYSTK